MHKVPAQLWIGHHDILVDHAHTYLQKVLCERGGCKTCPRCVGIRNHQHAQLLWLAPSKTYYTLADIQDVFQTVAFKLQEQEQFFIVFEAADAMSDVCANSLLKTIEEPPAGYHFIFLAARTEDILPTIISRCVVQEFHQHQPSITHQQLWYYCTLPTGHPTRPSITAIQRIIERECPNERETVTLADALLAYWLEQYKTNPQERTQRMIKNFEYGLTHPPMPGGAKLFWRTLILMIH